MSEKQTTATVTMIHPQVANSMQVQLTEAARREIGVEAGDPIVLVSSDGERRIISRVHELSGPDSETGDAVGVNNLHRDTLEVDLGSAVTIRACEPRHATDVTLRAAAPMCRPFGPEDLNRLRKSLYQRLVLPEGCLWMMSEACQHFGVVPGEWYPLRVVSTDPVGPVYIDHETTICAQNPQISELGFFPPELLPGSWEELRATVLDRDRGTCQTPSCRVNDADDLEVHFIVPPRTRGTLTPENCATLCTACHQATHDRRLWPSH